jgi:hypothetical protein
MTRVPMSVVTWFRSSILPRNQLIEPKNSATSGSGGDAVVLAAANQSRHLFDKFLQKRRGFFFTADHRQTLFLAVGTMATAGTVGANPVADSL